MSVIGAMFKFWPAADYTAFQRKDYYAIGEIVHVGGAATGCASE